MSGFPPPSSVLSVPLPTALVSSLSRGHDAAVLVKHSHGRLQVRNRMRNRHNPQAATRPRFWFADGSMEHVWRKTCRPTLSAPMWWTATASGCRARWRQVSIRS